MPPLTTITAAIVASAGTRSTNPRTWASSISGMPARYVAEAMTNRRMRTACCASLDAPGAKAAAGGFSRVSARKDAVVISWREVVTRQPTLKASNMPRKSACWKCLRQQSLVRAARPAAGTEPPPRHAALRRATDADVRASGQASASAPTMILELPRCRPPAIARRRWPRERPAAAADPSLLRSRCSPASLRRSGPPAPRIRAGRRVLSPRRCPLRSCRSMRARWASSPKSSRA